LVFLLTKVKDTLRPTRPVRFFSALSLEKNAPACPAFGDSFELTRLLKLQKYRRRKFVDRINDMPGGPTRTLP
jgi:hypothetical protein